MYPRAFAVGERLWSPATTIDLVDAKARLLIQRCRSKQRGFKSAPIEPGYCSVHYV